MTRDQLEAVVRAQLTRVTANALTTGVPSTAILNRAAETIIGAAERYGLTEYGATAERRGVLAEATGGITHFLDGTISACGRAGYGAGGTTAPARVTCRACQRTGPYRAALREAS